MVKLEKRSRLVNQKDSADLINFDAELSRRLLNYLGYSLSWQTLLYLFDEDQHPQSSKLNQTLSLLLLRLFHLQSV
jgi:hypothetical protein